MTVLSYGGPAAVVLALCWLAARVTPLSMRNPSLAALAVVAVFALIAITPLCGLMFDCGCDWPWNGLHHHCNVFDAHAKLKCPWCDSKVAGTLVDARGVRCERRRGLGFLRQRRVGGESAEPLHPRRACGRACLSSRLAGDGDARRARHGVSAAVHRIAVASGGRPGRSGNHFALIVCAGARGCRRRRSQGIPGLGLVSPEPLGASGEVRKSWS
jgi:hypothetical protein